MKQFIDFINKSYTAFHAIKNLEEMLEKANFEKLTEDCSWELEPGCSYYVIRNTSSIIAFKVPKSTLLQVIAILHLSKLNQMV